MEKRNTVQKMLVLDAVRALACHPTADEIYAEIQKIHKNVSKATVYRNLSSLCEDNVLLHVPLPNAADRYDHRADGHYHMVCKSCGAFSDAPFSYNTEMDIGAEEKTGFKNIKHNVLISGICPECAAKNV